MSGRVGRSALAGVNQRHNLLLLSGLGLNLGRRPPKRPSLLAATSPLRVRSRSMARSNSAKEPTICIIMRPTGVVVSMALVRLRKSAPASCTRSNKVFE